jgi:hypothetical protein
VYRGWPTEAEQNYDTYIGKACWDASGTSKTFIRK